MSSNLCYARTESPTPGQAWCQLSDDERLVLVNNTLTANTAFSNKIFIPVEAKQDGQIIIRLLESVSASIRGTLLLDIEAFLKESIDQGLVIWLEPFGDRNSLRNLRGIEVKS
ncbi:MAG TPA: hypothetical protein VIF37_03585 [Methylobacter sp.]|jgi:hypothetical protein